MIFFVLFCSLFEDILSTKSGKNIKKEQKRSKKTKIMIFFVLFRGHIFDQIGHKKVDFERVLKKNKKGQKRQRTSWVFPGGMIFFVVGPPPPPPLFLEHSYHLMNKFKRISKWKNNDRTYKNKTFKIKHSQSYTLT